MAEKRDVRKLNEESPALKRLTEGGEQGLGDILDALITGYNELRTQYNAMLAMIDADNGTIGTDYVASVSVASPAVEPLV